MANVSACTNFQDLNNLEVYRNLKHINTRNLYEFWIRVREQKRLVEQKNDMVRMYPHEGLDARKWPKTVKNT